MTRGRLALRIALFAAMAAGLFVALGRERLWRSSEERCFAVVGEMARSGDWLVPRLDGVPRLQKPPLFYWAAATAARVAGGPSVMTLRSVSAVAALALAALVFAAGRSLGGPRTADLSTAVLAGSALFYIRGRVGDAEMLLALLVFSALVVFEALWRTRDRRRLPLLAALVGLAFLAKATAALLGIFAPILVWLALRRELRLALRPVALRWGVVAAAIGLSWYAAILLRVPDAVDLFRSYLVGPLGAQAGTDATHLREVYYYLPRLPLQLLPAGLLLPWLVYEAWRRRFWRDEPRLQFYAAAFAAQLVAWSLVPSKQIHYLLPSVPLFALVAGRALEQRLFAPRA